MNTLTHESNDPLSETAILIGRLDELFGAYEPLTGDEVRHLPHLSQRRRAVAAEIADVCRDFGLNVAGSTSLDDLLLSQRQAKVLQAQLEALDLVRARLDAKRMLIEADLVRYASFFYGLARNAARFDEALRDRLERVSALLRRRKARHEKDRSVPIGHRDRPPRDSSRVAKPHAGPRQVPRDLRPTAAAPPTARSNGTHAS